METENSLVGIGGPEAGADRPVPCSSSDEDVFDRSELVSDSPESPLGNSPPGFDGPREEIDTPEKVYDRIQKVADRTLLGIQGPLLVERLDKMLGRTPLGLESAPLVVGRIVQMLDRIPLELE